MILINKSQTNTVVLTLTEKVSIDNPSFLFEFRDDQTNVSQYFICADISAYVYRYNKFVITEKTSPNALAGEVYLRNHGFYNYIIRQQASSINLDPDLSGSIVETGKVKVMQAITDAPVYEPDSNERVVYNG